MHPAGNTRPGDPVELSSLLGRQIEGIWHTGLVIYGYEYCARGSGCAGESR